MSTIAKIKPLVLIVISMLLLLSCADKSDEYVTREDREALFNHIHKTIMEREAFSEFKMKLLDLDVEKNLMSLKDEFLNAENEEEIFFALVKLSNARKDRHLSVTPVEGGLKVPDYPDRHLPIKFCTDYGVEGQYSLFIADISRDIKRFKNDWIPVIGDKLISINGMKVAEYYNAIEPYFRYSTPNGLWWKIAEELPTKRNNIPAKFYHEKDMTFEFTRGNGERYSLTLPYLAASEIQWQGFWKAHGDNKYSGFSQALTTQTYDLYTSNRDKSVVVLDWYGFREDLVKDMDLLVDYADKNGLLDHAVIVDATRSRGGSKGAYALQKLTDKPFKTTFGNLKISDVTVPFIEGKRKNYKANKLEDSGVKETIDDGSWLIDWLNTDVMDAVNAKSEYSTNVPFKSAHLPKDSDGILQPAEKHFTGGLICLLGPNGGSHLDQFAAMIYDNDLGDIIGMQAGGYSNTWEWDETLIFPLSKKPAAEFMWNIGHTIRPNGEILESNPVPVNEFIPLTSKNYIQYYDILLEKALSKLEIK